MGILGKNKLNHPALGTAGGQPLHEAIEAIYTTLSDNMPGRWKFFEDVAAASTFTYEHNLQVPFSELRVHVYTSTGGVQTVASGWSVVETTGFEQTKIDITAPPAGGPFDIYLYVSHEPMSDKLDLAGGTMTGSLLLDADPILALEAATKQYVDNLAQGLDVKASVVVATNASITLSGEQTIDDISVVDGDRVLVRGNSAPQNGIYICKSGSWERSEDMDSWLEVPGAFVFVEKGTVYGNTGWVCTADQGGTLGTTNINWSQFAGVGTYTTDGQGLQVSGTNLYLDVDNVTLEKGGPSNKLRVKSITATELSNGAVNLAGTKVSGTLPIGSGGTGQTTANGALNAFLPAQTGNTGKVLATDGSNTSWASAATVPSAGGVYSDGTSLQSTQYISNSNTSVSANDTTSFASGSAGQSIVAISNANAWVKKRVQLSSGSWSSVGTPKIRVSPGNDLWMDASDIFPSRVPAVSEWKSYTPTVSTGTWAAIRGYYQKVGSTLHLKIYAGPLQVNGSGVYTWTLPTGLTADITALGASGVTPSISDTPDAANTLVQIGTGTINFQASNWYMDGLSGSTGHDARAYLASSTSVALVSGSASTVNRADGVGSNSSFSSVQAVMQIEARIPIVEWASAPNGYYGLDLQFISANTTQIDVAFGGDGASPTQAWSSFTSWKWRVDVNK